jgi:hypothetical protein
MVSSIFQGVNNVVGKVADFVSPKKGQKVGFITDAAAVVATAVTAAVDPILAVQLAGTYLLARYTHNALVESRPQNQLARAPAEDVKEQDSMYANKLGELYAIVENHQVSAEERLVMIGTLEGVKEGDKLDAVLSDQALQRAFRSLH